MPKIGQLGFSRFLSFSLSLLFINVSDQHLHRLSTAVILSPVIFCDLGPNPASSSAGAASSASRSGDFFSVPPPSFSSSFLPLSLEKNRWHPDWREFIKVEGSVKLGSDSKQKSVTKISKSKVDEEKMPSFYRELIRSVHLGTFLIFMFYFDGFRA